MKKNYLLQVLLIFTFFLCYPRENIYALKQSEHHFSNGFLADSLNNIDQSVADSIYINVEILPEYPGGVEQFYKFLAKNLIYPKKAREENVKGRVTIVFVVEKDGTLADFKVAKGVSKELDEEALRVMKLSPKWMPGIYNGRAVRVSYSVPIMFELQINSHDNSPLYIFSDGQSISQEEMSKIKPEHIEKIDVLKGKKATEKYGERGKNGVIEITLKKK